VKFLWQLDVQGLDIVETKRRTPEDLKKIRHPARTSATQPKQIRPSPGMGREAAEQVKHSTRRISL
ncbi:hypothetical protein VU12_09940, partial [Desulfobulbus sp. US4]|nr:hypothetical protein [Desulfobulbus sp. US4]